MSNSDVKGVNNMPEIDIWKIASELEKEHVPKARKDIEEFVNSLHGQSFDSSEIIEKVIAPLIGKTSSSNKEFTINLLQRTIDELQRGK